SLVAGAELLAGVLQVGVNGTLRDLQYRGDLIGRLAPCGQLDHPTFAGRQIARPIGTQMMETKQAPEPFAGEVVKRDHRLGVEGEFRADGDDARLVGRERMHRHTDDTGTAGGTRLPEQDRFLEDATILVASAESESTSGPVSGLQDRILGRDYSGRRTIA